MHCAFSLSGVKRTWLFALHMSAFDPKRTWCDTAEFLAKGPLSQRPLNRWAADTARPHVNASEFLNPVGRAGH